MATLEQLKAALIKADAAGNTADAKVFADAIRKMQAQPPVGQDAMEAASAASQKFAPGSGPGPIQPDMMESVVTWLENAGGNIPIAGPVLQGIGDGVTTGVGSLVTGKSQQQLRQDLEDARHRRASKYPMTAASGSLTGTMAPFMIPGANALLGFGGKFIPDLGKAALANQGLYTADQLVRGNGGVEATGYGIPAIAGMAGRTAGEIVTKAGQGVANWATNNAQRAATKAVVKDAPKAADIRTMASGLFETSKSSGIGVKGDIFARAANAWAARAKGMDIDPDLDGEAMTLFMRVYSRAREAMSNGTVSIAQLHNLRQLANDVAQGAAKDRTKGLARIVIGGLDDLIGNLKAPMMTFPANRLGGAANPGKQLKDAIGLWAQGKKLALLEEAITKADFQKSGLENGLRLAFLGLLKNPETRRQFTKPELLAIRAVAKGTPLSNIMTLAGKLGLAHNNVVGATLGALLGGVPMMLAATGARKVSEKMAQGAADFATKVVGSRVPIPVVPQSRNLLAPAAVPADLLTRGLAFGG